MVTSDRDEIGGKINIICQMFILATSTQFIFIYYPKGLGYYF